MNYKSITGVKHLTNSTSVACHPYKCPPPPIFSLCTLLFASPPYLHFIAFLLSRFMVVLREEIRVENQSFLGLIIKCPPPPPFHVMECHLYDFLKRNIATLVTFDRYYQNGCNKLKCLFMQLQPCCSCLKCKTERTPSLVFISNLHGHTDTTVNIFLRGAI